MLRFNSLTGSLVLAVIAAAMVLSPPRARAQSTPATPATRTNGTDTAYVNGYNAGYAAGQQDRQAANPSNAHKFKAYQEATAGYTTAYGSRADYRSGYQGGFDDGYNDGYANRPETIAPGSGAAPATSPAAAAAAAPPANDESTDAQAATPNPPAYGAPAPAGDAGAITPEQAAATARATGYREGYNTGKYDIDRGAASDYSDNAEYQQAEIGYDTSLGAMNEYEKSFRDGFAAGYGDGYARKLYNTSLGGRPDAAGATAIADTPAAAGSPASGANPPASAASNWTPIAATPGPALAPPAAPKPAPPATRPLPAPVSVPAGTVLQTVLNSTISSKKSKVGDTFTASVTVPIWVGSVAVIPAGSVVHGTVAAVQPAGHMSQKAQIQLQYDSIEIPGNLAPVHLLATTTGVGNSNGSPNQEGTVDGSNPNGGKKIGTDSAIGAGVGGIFGGVGGLIRGAIAGAVVGTAGVMTSSKKDIDLKTGTNLTIRLDQPIQVTPLVGSTAAGG